MSDSAHHDSHAAGSNFVSSVVAIIAFIVLIVIVLWGLVHLTSFSRTWLGSILTRTTPGITVTVPKNATSSEPFTMTWKYSTSDKGTYAFLYQCKNGLQIKTVSPDNTENLVPCGAAYTIPGTGTSLALTPYLSGTSTVNVPVSIIFMPAATTTSGAQGSTVLVVRGKRTLPMPTVGTVVNPIASTTPAPATETPTPPPPTTSNPPVKRSAPDLSVRIVAVGIIDPSTGAFVKRAPMSPSDVSALQFDIGNIGGSPSGSYYFEARLPTTNGYTYTSQAQNPLGPGEHVLNTLRFTQANPMGGNAYVTITTEDVNNVNNDTSQWMNGPGYNYSAYPAYEYQQYQYVPQQPTYYQYEQYQYVPQYDYNSQPYYYPQPYNY